MNKQRLRNQKSLDLLRFPLLSLTQIPYLTQVPLHEALKTARVGNQVHLQLLSHFLLILQYKLLKGSRFITKSVGRQGIPHLCSSPIHGSV